MPQVSVSDSNDPTDPKGSEADITSHLYIAAFGVEKDAVLQGVCTLTHMLEFEEILFGDCVRSFRKSSDLHLSTTCLLPTSKWFEALPDV